MWPSLLSRYLVAFVVLSAFIPMASIAGESFPTLINLRNGWLPEGIETGRGAVLYSGSRANGGIYAIDLRTGEGRILVPGQTGRVAVGLAFDDRSNYIFVAGGATGNAFIYDADTGESVAAYRLAPSAPTFINDVVVTRDAAYFTESNRAVLYRVPLGAGGELPAQDAVQTVPLTGQWQQVSGFNANGIVATADGGALIVINSALGTLYEVDPATGFALAIDVGASMTMGDDLLLLGNTLYVVRNRLNQIAVIDLAPDLATGVVINVITNGNFDTPTTLAAFGTRLYAVNARFGAPPTPQTPYQVVGFER